ncbi:MAG: T9SS type A sorting domain-containing protein [Sphingobacteriales bacterium]|nr:MAG: T9SS type A sorting domain-containing protein [Sphingobacteriales bacterium]
MKIRLILTFIILILSNQAYCTSFIHLDGVNVLPLNPTKNDAVKIIVKAWTGVPGVRNQVNYTIFGNTIDIIGCYSIKGGLATVQYYTDTLDLGILPIDNYTINISLYSNFSPGDCTGFTDSSKDTTQFKVFNTPNIDSIVVFPGNPTCEDDVHIAFHVSTVQAGKRISFSHSVTGNTITAHGCYALTDSSDSRVLTQYSDTVNLGRLSDTAYDIKFTAYLGGDTSTCSSQIDSTKATKHFTVKQPDNVRSVQLAGNAIYPNPAGNSFSIRNAGKNALVAVYTITGQLVLQTYKTAQIDISQLPGGVYYVHVLANGTRSIGKLTKE